MSAAAELPRGLVAVTGAWFAVAAVGAFTRLPLHIAPSTMTPGIAQVLVLCTLAPWILWPLVRLSGRTPRAPIAQAVLDGATLACMIQLPLWPLRLGTPWPIERTLLLDLQVLAGIVTVGGLIAAGTSFASGWVRGGAMAGCVLVATGIELPLASVGLPAPALLHALPGGIPALLASMRSTATVPDAAEWQATAVLCLVCGCIAVGGALVAAVAGRGRAHATDVAAARRLG